MKHIFCLLITSWICYPLYAQPNLVEKSHYLFPEFTRGVVLMKDGKTNNASLNYNSLTEEMIFENKGTKMAIAPNQIPLIDTVFINNRKFVVFNDKFVESVYRSTWGLYIEHKCKLEEQGTPAGYGGTTQTSAAKSVSTLASEGRVIYDLKLPDRYKTNPYFIYWLSKNGELNNFANLRELKKLFEDEKDQIKKYSKTHHVKYEDQESIVQLIGFLVSN